MIRGLAKGAKRDRGAFSGGIDILTRGEVQGIVKNTTSLATLTEWNLVETYWATRQNIHAHRAGLFYADVIYRMLTDHDPHPQLFDVFAESLGALGGLRGIRNWEMGNANRGFRERACPADRMSLGIKCGNADVTLGFLWAVLCETGYRPELQVDAETGESLDESSPTLAFDPKAGGLVADTGEDGRWRVRRETVEILRGVAAKGNGKWTMGNEQCGPGAAGEVWGGGTERAGRLLATYICEILGDEPPTMQLVFGERPER